MRKLGRERRCGVNSQTLIIGTAGYLSINTLSRVNESENAHFQITRNEPHSRRDWTQNVNLFTASQSAQWTWLFPDLMTFPSSSALALLSTSPSARYLSWFQYHEATKGFLPPPSPTPLGWYNSSLQDTPSIKLASTHLYTWVEPGHRESKVSCPRTERHVLSQGSSPCVGLL